MRKGDDITTFTVPKVKTIRSLNLQEPLGPPRPVVVRTPWATWAQALTRSRIVPSLSSPTNHTVQETVLCEALKFPAKSPDHEIFTPSDRQIKPSKDRTFTSDEVQKAVVQRFRQRPKEFFVRWYTPICASMKRLPKYL